MKNVIKLFQNKKDTLINKSNKTQNKKKVNKKDTIIFSIFLDPVRKKINKTIKMIFIKK